MPHFYRARHRLRRGIASRRIELVFRTQATLDLSYLVLWGNSDVSKIGVHFPRFNRRKFYHKTRWTRRSASRGSSATCQVSEYVNTVIPTAVWTAVPPDSLDGALRWPDWCRRRPVDWPTVVADAVRVRSVEKDEQTSPTTSTKQRRTLAGRDTHRHAHWRRSFDFIRKQFGALVELTDAKVDDVVAVAVDRSSVEDGRRQHGEGRHVIELQSAVVTAQRPTSSKRRRRRQQRQRDDQRPSLLSRHLSHHWRCRNIIRSQ